MDVKEYILLPRSIYDTFKSTQVEEQNKEYKDVSIQVDLSSKENVHEVNEKDTIKADHMNDKTNDKIYKTKKRKKEIVNTNNNFKWLKY